jgi:hypothetical protein
VVDQTKLTQAEKELIAKWLNEKSSGKPPPCPFCGSNTWAVGDHLVAAPVMGTTGTTTIGGPSYPQAMLVSDPCGYTVFFNAVVIGLLHHSLPPEGEDKK